MEALKILFQRIQQLDPENVFKIITGYSLLSRDLNGVNITDLAYGTDDAILSLINTIKAKIGLPPFPYPLSTMNVNNSLSYFDHQAAPILIPFDQSSSPSFFPCFPFSSDSGPSIPQPAKDPDQTKGFDVGNQPPFSFFQHQFPLQKSQEPKLLREVCPNFCKGFCELGDDCKYSHSLKQVETEQQMDLKSKHTSEKGISNPSTQNRASKHISQGVYDKGIQSEEVGYRVNDCNKDKLSFSGDDRRDLLYNPLFDSPFVYDTATRIFCPRWNRSKTS